MHIHFTDPLALVRSVQNACNRFVNVIRRKVFQVYDSFEEGPVIL